MAVRMVSLKSSKSGEWIARKGIPVDARAEYKRLYGVRHEVILRVPAGTSKAQAKAQLGQWQAEVETQIERIRAAKKGRGEPLTKLNALALAGRWYSWFVAKHESDPGPPEHWEDRKEHLLERVWHPHAPIEHLENANPDPTWPWTRWPEVREAVRPEVAEMALQTFRPSLSVMMPRPGPSRAIATDIREAHCNRALTCAEQHPIEPG
jgi:hypothetical protein